MSIPTTIVSVFLRPVDIQTFVDGGNEEIGLLNNYDGGHLTPLNDFQTSLVSLKGGVSVIKVTSTSAFNVLSHSATAGSKVDNFGIAYAKVDSKMLSEAQFKVTQTQGGVLSNVTKSYSLNLILEPVL
jgi:hypothetical protein